MNKEEDLCSCEEPEVVTATLAIFRAGTKDEEYDFCRKCKKEHKKKRTRMSNILDGWNGSGNGFLKTGSQVQAYQSLQNKERDAKLTEEMKRLNDEMIDSMLRRGLEVVALTNANAFNIPKLKVKDEEK